MSWVMDNSIKGFTNTNTMQQTGSKSYSSVTMINLSLVDFI